MNNEDILEFGNKEEFSEFFVFSHCIFRDSMQVSAGILPECWDPADSGPAQEAI